jgi:hypothetical protein
MLQEWKSSAPPKKFLAIHIILSIIYYYITTFSVNHTMGGNRNKKSININKDTILEDFLLDVRDVHLCAIMLACPIK